MVFSVVFRIVGAGTKELRQKKRMMKSGFSDLWKGFPWMLVKKTRRQCNWWWNWNSAAFGTCKAIALQNNGWWLATEMPMLFCGKNWKRRQTDVVIASDDGMYRNKRNRFGCHGSRRCDRRLYFFLWTNADASRCETGLLKNRFRRGFQWKKRWRAVLVPVLPGVCESKEIDSHSKVKNKRICKDGPVFLSTDIEL